MNLIYKINNTNTLLYRSKRKIIWFSLPDLKVIEKYYTNSTFLHINAHASIMVVHKNCLTFLTLQIPPLAIIQFQKEFLEWEPIGGFCLSLSVVLYDKHSIYFYNKGQSLKQTWTIDVVQEIEEIKYAQSENYIGMKVRERSNTLYLWDLGDISTKSSQEIVVFDDIVKWEFYLEDMLVVMTKSEIRTYFPSDGLYNLQFFTQIQHQAIDFCFLERPKVRKHSGRRLVYPLAILGREGNIYIYELYDMDKRLKNSLGNLVTKIEVPSTISTIKGGFENDSEQIILICEGLNHKPQTYVLNEKYFLMKQYRYLPELDENIKQVQYSNEYIGALVNAQQWKIFKLIGKQHTQYLKTLQAKFLFLANNFIYTFNSTLSVMYEYKTFLPVCQLQFKCPNQLFFLLEAESGAYFVGGIKVYKLNLKQKTMKAVSFVIRNERFKLFEVNMHTKSLVYRMGDDFVLMEYKLENEKIVIANIRTTKNKIISLRNGRWAEMLNNSFLVGKNEQTLVSFDLQKFFKYLTQDNILFEYQLYWTTHDGIILIIKNYIFIIQLIESSDGYSLTLIKKMQNYLHHRMDPDASIIEVINPRQLVIREDNRVIKLGSKLNYYVSSDPYALPDTLLQRQLQMRKYYPPHHPKIIGYLTQMGSFSLLPILFKNIREWVQGNGKIDHLYKRIGAEFYISYNVQKDENLVPTIEGEEQEVQSLKKLCEMVLQQPSKLLLEENGALVLESQIQSMIFRDQNSRSMDYFSSIVLMQQRLPSKKNKPFKSLQVAYLLHSINKQEAITMLKPQKMQWSWIQKFSIILWYDGKEQIKKWVDEIGANQFRKEKQPFDCLFWYTLIGKKSLLITLFKSHQFNSKEHGGIFNFLQKDFAEPKNQSAAVKNAYVLVDKKRYIHALAFFIYGNKIEEAVSLCLNKIKDINLAMLVTIFCNYDKKKVLEILEKEGDIWTKHIAYFIKGQHIKSFNCLFDKLNPDNWNYSLQLSGFRPCVKPFAEMIEKSIPVKREIQQQKYEQMQSNTTDIFDSFYSPTQTQVESEQKNKKQIIQLQPKYPELDENTVEFYIRNNCPSLALMIDQTNKRARRAYQLEKFMLTKKISPEVFELAEEMEDIISILFTKLQNEEKGIKQILNSYAENMISAIKELGLDGIVKKNKACIGKLLHLCYFANQIILLKPNFTNPSQIQIILKELPLLSILGQIMLCLEFQNYEMIEGCVKKFILFMSTFTQATDEEGFWDSLKADYAKLAPIQQQKSKNDKLLDQFQHTLYRYRYRRPPQHAFENMDVKLGINENIIIRINKEIISSIALILNVKELIQKEVIECFEMIAKKLRNIEKKWADEETLINIDREVGMMYQEGSVSKLKVIYFSDFLNDNFEPVCRSMCSLKEEANKLGNIPLQRSSLSMKKQENLGLQAVEVFRNKQDGLKSFIINKNEGEGMEVAVMFKKGLKKFEICESLINRNRTHDGYFLAHEDSFYNISSNINFDLVMNKKYPPLIENTLAKVLENRKEYDGKGIIRGSTKRGDPQFLKQLDPIPYLDHNELNSIECHHFLPVFLLGGKGQISICNFSTLKNYNRIRCPGMSEIVKIASFEQRVLAMDGSGSLGCYSFDTKISGNCVFNLKKAGIVDFCMITPTIYGFITNNSIQVYDTLLHPKRQNIFKIQLSQQPSFITSFLEEKIVVGRKNELLFYDIRMDVQEETRDVESKIRYLTSNHQNKILAGRSDGKVKIFDVNDKNRDYQVKCSRGLDEKEKASIDQIEIMGECGLAMSSQGSIFLIDKI